VNSNGADVGKPIRGVLALYTPAVDRQPDPANPTQTRDVRVANRVVMWSSPFTGDLWVGRGTLLDLDTQALLTNYVNAGGRLLIHGRDVAWALTQNGLVPNQPFLANVLKAQFVRDLPTVGWFIVQPPNNFQLSVVNAEHPLCHGGIDEFHPPTTLPNVDPEPLNLAGPRGVDAFPAQNIGGGIADPIDQIQPIGGATAIYNFDVDGVPGQIAWEDAASNARVVFASFGYEQVGRFYEEANNAITGWNYRGKITHAALCWLTHWSVSGRVTDTSLQPVAGALVRAQPSGGTAVLGTALTQADGSFIIRGLPPAFGSTVTFSAQAPGFVFQHFTQHNQHGMRATTTSLQMSPAPPGAISGRVTSQQNGAGISGVTVQATLAAPPGFSGPTVYQATTAADGTYRIAPVPNGSYTVEVNPVPSGFSSPDPATATITVVPGQDTTGTSFTLTPSGGGGPGPGPDPGNLRLPAGLNIIALPGDYSDIDVAALFGLPADQVRLAAFSAAANQYAYYPSSPADRIRLGRGYFVRLPNEIVLTANRPVPTAPVRVNVVPGWELVGHVGTTAVPLSQVRVQIGSGPEISFAEAVSQGVLRQTAYRLSGSSYQTASQLEPLRGVWLRVLRAATLIIPPAPTAGAASVRAAVAPVLQTKSRGDWQFSVVARAGEMADRASLGVASGASNGFNAGFDLERPPRFTDNGRFLTVSFPRQEWGQDAGGDFMTDIRERSNGTQSWEFVVRTNMPLENVTLSWPDAGAAGAGVDLVLVDLGSNQRLSLRGSSSYTFRTGPQGAERRFRIVARRRGSP